MSAGIVPRIVCIDVPSLALQILRRDHPSWGGFPLAVVAEDRPQASVLSVSRSARELGIRPGMRYAAALGISRELRAAPVARARIDEVRAELVGALHRLSPRVEPDAERESVIWVDPRGMLALFGTYERWAEEAQAALDALNLFGTVVVGFLRMPALAVARGLSSSRKMGSRTANGIVVLSSIEEEKQRASRTPLSRLEVPPTIAEALHLLGVNTLGELLALPIGEVSVRLGPDAGRLHRAFGGGEPLPLSPAAHPDPIEIEAEIEPPDDDRSRLLFCVKGALHALMAALIERRLALGTLRVSLHLERAANLVRQEPLVFLLEPATASRDTTSLVELIRLRLEALQLPSRVERVQLSAIAAALEGTQLLLSESPRRRDPAALARGLSRLRAAFGDEAVTQASLESSWAPEASFRWQPIRDLPPGSGRSAPHVTSSPSTSPTAPLLLRRVLTTLVALASDARGLPRLGPSPLSRLIGPYRIQSSWWDGEGRLMRDYFYGERADGAILWLFRDQTSGHWFLQGVLD